MYPVLFNIGDTLFFSLGLFLILAFVAFNLSVYHLSGVHKLNIKFWSSHLISLVAVTIVGARLGYAATHLDRFIDSPGDIIVPDGFSFYGGILFFLVLLYFYTKKNKENILAWTDLFSVSFFSWLFFSGIGHFLDGTNFGTPTDLSWGVTFDNISSPVTYTVPIHPTQIYQALFALVLFPVLFFMYKKTKTSGLLTFVAAFLLGTCDYFLNYLLGEPTTMIGTLRLEQLVDLILVAVSSGMLFSFLLKRSEARTFRSQTGKQ